MIHNPLPLLLAAAFTICLKVSAAEPLAETDIGQFDYMIHCQGCHQADGSGTPGATPDLRTYGAALLRTIEGRQYFVRVPGSRNA
ncbi:MAG: c-type cytochrome, partial [Pseudomonadota bacterium]